MNMANMNPGARQTISDWQAGVHPANEVPVDRLACGVPAIWVAMLQEATEVANPKAQ